MAEVPLVLPKVNDQPNLKPGEGALQGGKRVKKATVKQLKKMLKKAGLKTTGKRGALTRRAHKAHLKMKGGEVLTPAFVPGGSTQAAGRRRSRRSRRGFRLF